MNFVPDYSSLTNETFKLLAEISNQFQETSPKPLINRQDLAAIFNSKGTLSWSDIINIPEIEKTLPKEEIANLESLSQRLSNLGKTCNKFPACQDITQKSDKTTQDFLILFCERLTSLPRFVECAWVWAFGFEEIKTSEEEKEQETEESPEQLRTSCPVVELSGIDRDIEDYLDLIETLNKYKIKEFLLEELKDCLDQNNTIKLSFLLAVFDKILTEYELTEDYCRDLSRGLCRIIKVDNTTTEGQVLLQVKQNLQSILTKKFKSIMRALEVYEMLDTNQNQLNSFPKNCLEEDITFADELIEELNFLFPKEIISFPLRDSSGLTSYDGNIALDSNYFESTIGSKKIVKAMFTMIHELAHRKRFLHLAEKNIYYNTTKGMKDLYQDVNVDTAGDMLEKKAFGGHINLDNVTKEMADKLLDFDELHEEGWEAILKKLIEVNMLRKSPYVEENYNYITAMMDNMKLQQETLFNQPTPYFNNQMHDPFYNNNNPNLFTNNTNQFMNNNHFAYNVRDIDTKKQIQTDCSVYDKTLDLLNKGAQMTMEMDTMGTAPGNMYNQYNQNLQQNQNYNMNMMEQAPTVQCIGCLKEKSQGLMQLENQMDASQFTQCNYCKKASCGPCTRRCDCCGRVFCKICVNIRYEEYMDKIVCLYCS